MDRGSGATTIFTAWETAWQWGHHDRRPKSRFDANWLRIHLKAAPAAANVEVRSVPRFARPLVTGAQKLWSINATAEWRSREAASMLATALPSSGAVVNDVCFRNDNG